MTLNVEQIKTILRDKISANLVVAEHTESGHFYRYTPTNQLFASVTTKCGILDSPHLKKWAARLAVEYIINKTAISTEVLIPESIIRLKESAILAHQDQFEEAGDIGTRGHKVIEEYLIQWINTGIKPPDIRSFIKENDSRIYAITRSAELFCKEWNVVPIVSEMFVASPKYKFAGTLDSLMMVGKITEKGTNINCEHDYWNISTTNLNKLKCLKCGQKMEQEFAIVDWKSSNSIDKVEYAMQTAAYWQGLYEMTGLKPKRIYIVRLDKTQAKYEVRVLTNRTSAFRAFVQTAHVYDWLNNGKDKLITATPRENIKLNNLIQL